MIKTDFVSAEEVRRSVLHSKIARKQAVFQLLSGTHDGKKRDSLSISASARSFSKEHIAALVDRSANVSANELSYYFANYNNPSAILDAINFGEHVECGYNPDFKDYGAMYFTHNGIRQVVPIYAVPKINANSLPGMRAVNNSLVLKNQSYYAWSPSSGGRYPWAVSNGHIGWASSESLLTEETNRGGSSDRWEMRKAGNILSNLAQGVDLWGYKNEDVLKTCASVGFTPGFFSIDAGAGKHTYILQEFGGVIDVDKNITRWNNMNWIEVGYKEGDTFSIYGNEYTVDSSGHIHISANDTFTLTDVKFARRDI